MMLAVGHDAAQLVQLGVHTLGYHLALANLGGRVLAQRPRQLGLQLRTVIYLLGHTGERAFLIGLLREQYLQRQELVNAPPQLHHLAGRDAARSGAGEDTLEVAHRGYPLREFRGQFPVVQQGLHAVLPYGYLSQIPRRHGQPRAQQAGAHRGRGLVNHVQKGHAPRSGRLH